MKPTAKRVLTTAALTGFGAVAAQLLPAALFWPDLRRAVAPGLSGLGDRGHVALTFDDGPHPEATPLVLAELAERNLRATFFLLGSQLALRPWLGREIADAGHEVALHGWEHRYLSRYGPRRTLADLTRARDVIAEATGTPPRWFRPPYGVLTSSALRAAKKLELTPVLWTCWGWDWSATSTPDSVFETVTKELDGGGTVLLHDSDVAADPGAWHSMLGALPRVLDECADRGWRVGPLREHRVVGAASTLM